MHTVQLRPHTENFPFLFTKPSFLSQMGEHMVGSPYGIWETASTL